MSAHLNLGNSIFKGFNDQNGILICGYEHGESKADIAKYEANKTQKISHPNKDEVTFTFANKEPFLGKYSFPYDSRIATWFRLWGHPLNHDGLGDDFTKSIMQTNLSNTQSNHVQDYDVIASGFDNFVELLKELKPSLILFMGVRNSDFINKPDNLSKIENILGQSIAGRKSVTAETSGRKFRVIFQDFEHCHTVTFPHPSGTIGLTNEYISKFEPQLNEILTKYKAQRGF